MKSDTKILIPARMASTRFPGKPLAPIEGLPMVVYCARNALKTGLDVIVCTDSQEIRSVCDLYDINSILTPKFNTGTDRIAWVSEQINSKYLINLQGDEPLITKDSINKIVSMLPELEKDQNLILNGINPVNSEEAFDPNNVKCAVIKENNKVLYFSRKPLLNSEDSDLSGTHYFKQLGLYAMSFNTLKKFAALEQSNLEKSEKVELLRWIENGYHIKACIINKESISVDTPQDLVNVIEKLSSQNS